MRWIKRAAFAGVLLFLGIVGFTAALLSPVQRSQPYTVDFAVLPGERLPDIAATLHRVGLIREPRAFMALAVARRDASRLRSGAYRATSDRWAWEVLDLLVSGAQRDTTATVVEGSWMAEIGQQLGPLVAGGVDSFLAAATDSIFMARLGVPGATAEGYLFPDTYRFAPGIPARSLVQEMVVNFFRKWSGELEQQALAAGVNLRDTVILASIVEAEAQIAEERPRIAAVYRNRLDIGLPLQADPTVSYAQGKRLARTLYDDLEIQSPYNTYLVAGLPPGPIGNPGLAALRASLWPEPDCRDLYFVATGDGGHLFAPTHEGHLRNRQLVRQAVTARP